MKSPLPIAAFAVVLLCFQITAVAQQTSSSPIRKWWLAGPVSLQADSAVPDVASQQKFFNAAIKNTHIETPGSKFQVEGKELEWFEYNSPGDIIDLDSIFGRSDYAAAFAFLQIPASADTVLYLAAGSDDAIRIWLNGSVVHNNWTPRGIQADEDLVPLALVKGNNSLLLRVQDIAGGWGFTARFLDKKGLTDALVTAAGAGNLDDCEMLLRAGADANAAGTNIYSPIVAAKLKGRQSIVRLLKENGAKDEMSSAGAAAFTHL